MSGPPTFFVPQNRLLDDVQRTIAILDEVMSLIEEDIVFPRNGSSC